MISPTTYCDTQIIIPVYNDWASVTELLPAIAKTLVTSGRRADILLVDDGSVQSPPQTWQISDLGIQSIRVLSLHRNLGHQRAICLAMCHLRGQTNVQHIVVMDGDGEDSPTDIPRLLERLNQNDKVRVVFAERTKRSEGLVFSFFYAIYRLLHHILVGQKIRVGNFSVVNREGMESLCASAELWNHYAASAFATRQPMAFVATERAKRLAGRSQMNFPALVMHGLSALSVFSGQISTRLLLMSGLAVALTIGGMVAVTLVRLTTGYAIPGWATTAFGILTILLVQITTFMLTFCFLILFTRGFSPFIPVRDYHFYVRQVSEVWHEKGS